MADLNLDGGLTAERMLALEQIARRDREQAVVGESEPAMWLRACIAEQCGRHEEASRLLSLLREGLVGEERAIASLALARTLLAQGALDGSWHAVGSAVRGSQSSRLLRQAERFYKQFRKLAPALPVVRRTRVALVGSSTLNFLGTVLHTQLLANGIEAQLFVGGFGLYQLEILDPQSELSKFAPQVVVILADWRSLGLEDETLVPPPVVQGLRTLWRQCRERLQAFVVQCNFEIPAVDAFGRLSAASAAGRARTLRALNMELWQAAESESGVAILDLDQCSAIFGKSRWSDPVQWHTAKQYPSSEALPLLGRHMTSLIRAILGLSKKCLVLDLDGVLWGGVIGEDGVNGIELGGSPQGEAFVEFQRYVRGLARRGVLLAVCSKNNREDALQPFREHPEMILKESDIALFVANWSAKDENLREIALRLNIGLDSLVFVDDNPVERARVRQNVPEVEVIEMPVDAAGYVTALNAGAWFEALGVTGEDRNRAASMRQNQERSQLAEVSGGDVDSYLAGLAMKVRLEPFDEKNLGRVVQLINKTNQFNLTTRRVTEGPVRAWVGAAGVYTQALRLEDRFGDSGLTGVLIAFEEGQDLRVDNWLMSCRILGRRLDEVMVASLKQHARNRGLLRIVGEYIGTAKNAQVAEIYERFGFVAAGAGRFVFEVGKTDIEFPAILEVVDLTRSSIVANT